MKMLFNEFEIDFYGRNLRKLSSSNMNHKDLSKIRAIVRQLDETKEKLAVELDDWQLDFILKLAQGSAYTLEHVTLEIYKQRGDIQYIGQTEYKIGKLKQTIAKCLVRKEQNNE